MSNFFLMPVSFLYKLGVLLRHRLFDWGILKQEKFDIPVVCIGNITVGGTGKTPMAEMVIAYMAQRHHVALISRGTGGERKDILRSPPIRSAEKGGASRCRSSANFRYGRGRVRETGRGDPPSSAGASGGRSRRDGRRLQHRYVEPKVISS